MASLRKRHALWLSIGRTHETLKRWKKIPSRGLDRLLFLNPGPKARLEGFGDACFVPIPQNPWRSWRLGRNPAEDISGFAARLSGGTVHRILEWVNHSGPQARLPRAERECQERTFRLRAGERLLDPSRTYIVTDDFTTTGKTLEAAADSLRAKGAKRVESLVLGYRPYLRQNLKILTAGE